MSKPPRRPKTGDVPAIAPAPGTSGLLPRGSVDGVPRYKLEDERNVAILQALFYWQLADRQGTSKTDYQYRAQKFAARALDRQVQLDKPDDGGGGG